MSSGDEKKKRTFRAPPRVPRLRKKRGGAKPACGRGGKNRGHPPHVANKESYAGWSTQQEGDVLASSSPDIVHNTASHSEQRGDKTRVCKACMVLRVR